MYKVTAGADWTIDFASCTWDDGVTNIPEADLAGATITAIVAGLAATVIPDPEEGVRLRLEVAKALTADVRPRQYNSGVEITISGKLSVITFEVFVQPGMPVPRAACS